MVFEHGDRIKIFRNENQSNTPHTVRHNGWEDFGTVFLCCMNHDNSIEIPNFICIAQLKPDSLPNKWDIYLPN